VADIFVSYTSSDQGWAFWIGQELEKLGHKAHLHDWELSAGGDIAAWMEERHDNADHILCVVSKAYLTKPYSRWERLAAQWAAAAGERPTFVLPVLIEDCELRTLLAHIKRCDLYEIDDEDVARTRFAKYLAPAAKPAGPVQFPPKAKAAKVPTPTEAVPFPGGKLPLSNITISVPRHFLGREDELAAIHAALTGGEDRVATATLYGLRGVGKTTLAAAYAQRHKADYRATWWITAQTPDAMRADLISLGVRLGWVAADQKEDAALERVRDGLRDEGEGLLLIYDNAVDAASLRPHLPTAGAARALVTSNSPAWREVAATVEVRVWPKEVGADYLIARTGRDQERAEAEALSEALGGLTLAHQQAAAYCERLGVSLSEYRKRFEAAPARLLDAAKYASAEYHGGLTAAKAFSIAIDEAAKLHPAAEPLIAYAALLAPEPIPLFLFSDAREKFGEPLASQLADEGLDEAIGALRAFALVDRETVDDERDASVTTETIRPHRLVRIAAVARRQAEEAEVSRRVLVEALAAVYPQDVFNNPNAWPRARRLNALALDLVAGRDPPSGAETAAASLMIVLGEYRQGALGAYAAAQPLYERALAINEKSLGLEHPKTAVALFNLALLLKVQGDFQGARPLYERALAIDEKSYGLQHLEIAPDLNNLAVVLQHQGDFQAARSLLERALAIYEKALGPEHPDTAMTVNNLAGLLREQGDLKGAQPLYKRALAMNEKALGPEHPDTAMTLNNLAGLLREQGDPEGARPLCERALAIREKSLGPEHPNTARSLNTFALLLHDQGDLDGARPLHERALAIREKALGPDHPDTATSLHNLGLLLYAQGDLDGARPLHERALAIREKALGPGHADTILIRDHLANLPCAD
jgi:tetratricopeptide (TPR) repeat protein